MSHVAGHGPLLADASGRLAIKKALPAEIDFYESSRHMYDCGYESPVSVLVQQWLPYYYGTLALEPEVNDDELRALVMEDLTADYAHPNVLDVKLGNVLHEPDATPIKKAKMIQQSITSTSWETGIRLTGFKVWQPKKRRYRIASKVYGRTLCKETLHKGITAFFPDSPYLHCVLQSAIDQVSQIIATVEGVEYRFVGSSLLVVYEGTRSTVRLIDFGRARAAPGEGPDEGVLLGLRTFHTLLQDRIRRISPDASR